MCVNSTHVGYVVKHEHISAGAGATSIVTQQLVYDLQAFSSGDA